jgi:hypothetical protein
MSKLISGESYLREAIRYIHLNPVRAGTISTMEDLDVYPWTGHRQITAGGACWMDIGAIREFFNADGNEGESSYRDFINAGCSRSRRDSNGIGASFENSLNGMDYSECTDADRKKPPELFFDILAHISVLSGVRIISKNRGHSEVNARRAVLVACVDRLEVSAARVSKWLGISEDVAQYLLRTKVKLQKKV